jgi:DNA-binding CsgD family transcriptional regulator
VAELLRALDQLYGATDVATFANRALGVVRRMITCEVTSYNEIDSTRPQVTFVVDPAGADDFPDSSALFAAVVGQHPLIVHYQRTGDGRALRLSDFVADRMFRASALYRDFYRLIGVERQLALTLPSQPSQVIGIALSRSGPDFSERDRQVADVLRSHLSRAYRSAMALSRVTGASTVPGESGTPTAVVIELDQKGRPTRVSDEAIRLARRNRPAYGSSPLPEEVSSWVTRRLSVSPENHVISPPEPLVLKGEHSDLVVHLTTRGEGGYRLVLEECQRSTDLSPRLTPRQSEVLRLVAEGRTDKEIAMILGTSVRTVQKQLELSYRALEVGTRTAAVHRLALAGYPRERVESSLR